MKMLIHGLNYAPECIGTSAYTTRMSEFMHEQGHEVDVVTAHPYYPEWTRRPDWPTFRYITRHVAQETLRIVHCPLFIPSKPTFKARLLHYFSFLISSFPVTLMFCLRRSPDVVIAIAPSLVASLTALICGRLIGAKMVLHVQDFEVDAAFATKAVRARSFLGRAALRFENWMLRRFDVVSTISMPMQRKAVQKGVVPERIFEFRNWANLSAIHPLDVKSPMRAEMGIIVPYVILYSGNIAAKQGLDIIPAAARRLAHRADIAFVICGNGAYRATLEQACAGMDNVRFLPLQPFSRLNELLGIADIHVLPQISDVEELVLPSKLANMLASGRPVITTAAPESALACEVKGCGMVVPPGDDAALAAAVEHLLAHPELRDGMGKSARIRALSRWDEVAILHNFEDQLKQALRNEPISAIYKDEIS